jgi:hypothetical protein
MPVTPLRGLIAYSDMNVAQVLLRRTENVLQKTASTVRYITNHDMKMESFLQYGINCAIMKY